jgi:hypothetical protein
MFISDATTSLVLVGDAKSGKSSLISSYLSSNIREEYIPTTGIDIVRAMKFFPTQINYLFYLEYRKQSSVNAKERMFDFIQ